MSKASRWLATWWGSRQMDVIQPQTLVVEAVTKHLAGHNSPCFYAPMWLHGDEQKRLVAWVDSDGDLAPGPRFKMTSEIIALRPKYALALAHWILDTFDEEPDARRA